MAGKKDIERDKQITQTVLSFWFDQDVVRGYCEYRPIWFETIDLNFDQEIRERFSEPYVQAIDGRYASLADTELGALALIIMLDQFSRNMFRGSPQRYSQDVKALEIANHAIAQNFDKQLPLLYRCYLYMPFQHSEDLEIQRQSVELFETLGDKIVSQRILAAAKEHLTIVEKFGRFPNRNDVLSRKTTRQEQEFLAACDCVHLTSA